ncbi:hypothetical protein SAPIO_CDS9163 [Scedosporium apiospermum]|uniref:Uncharacterized protein n=1 Tax=Pseudallescheria apiosperma TaxID=563466 RepID=A0A084FYG9_PSEDA|nr:uncharacterized protein SAPIO_CDS9163 [Scedosporium apiospermum]KEZ40131.1 hypothetical protein SAPIO_CDS9163 [Scedosporium apiospermum]
MTTLAKTIVATGVSSGLGFEAIKHLLGQIQQPYRVILGARNANAAKTAYEEVKFDTAKHTVSVLPLELGDLKDVKRFARQALEAVGSGPIDYLLLNAALGPGGETLNLIGSKWREIYVVNSLSQHYLVHLLKEKLISSRSRLIFVSSGGIRGVSDPSVLEDHLKAGTTDKSLLIYNETKFVGLLNAHWWRRQLTWQCAVVAVSPGFIPNTGLGRGLDWKIPTDIPDAKSVSEGKSTLIIYSGQNITRAFFQDNLPEDPDQIFLTSWGEWWPKDVYENTLDKSLQDKWSPTLEDIEAEERVN